MIQYVNLNPRSLMNCRYDKLKETLQETHYNQTVKRQRDNLADRFKRQLTCSLPKDILSETLEGRRQWDDIFKVLK